MWRAAVIASGMCGIPCAIAALPKRTKLSTIPDHNLIWDVGHGSLAAGLVKV
jgi:hypothetical protein